MNDFEKVYVITSFIEKGKVLTYQKVSDIANVSPRVVGFALHSNKDPKKIPCHRVVYKDGRLSKGYAFGGENAQREKLEKEGVILTNDKVRLGKYLQKIEKPLALYFDLLFTMR